MTTRQVYMNYYDKVWLILKLTLVNKKKLQKWPFPLLFRHSYQMFSWFPSWEAHWSHCTLDESSHKYVTCISHLRAAKKKQHTKKNIEWFTLQKIHTVQLGAFTRLLALAAKETVYVLGHETLLSYTNYWKLRKCWVDIQSNYHYKNIKFMFLQR